jgi:type VI protein secretion system component VasF
MSPSEPDVEELTRAEALRERLLMLMDQANSNAMREGLPNELIVAADFAVCAFIDEVLLSYAFWRDQAGWLKKPLQFVRHGTATAGEDFYRLLDGLLEEAGKKCPAIPPVNSQNPSKPPNGKEAAASNHIGATLEIFALCLVQGFTGMFYDNPKAIRKRLDEIGRFVPAVSCPGQFITALSEKTARPGPLKRRLNLFPGFTLLDWALWLIPLVLTALLYHMCRIKVEHLLQVVLRGIVQS